MKKVSSKNFMNSLEKNNYSLEDRLGDILKKGKPSEYNPGLSAIELERSLQSLPVLTARESDLFLYGKEETTPEEARKMYEEIQKTSKNK